MTRDRSCVVEHAWEVHEKQGAVGWGVTVHGNTYAQVLSCACAGWCIVACESTFSAMRTLTNICISPGHSNFAGYLEQCESHVLLEHSSNPPGVT